MLKRFTLLSFFIASLCSLSAQINIYSNKRNITESASGVYYAIDLLPSSDNEFILNYQRLNRDLKWNRTNISSLRLQNLSSSVWLKIKIDSIISTGNFDYLQITNPHINILKCWVMSGDSVLHSFPTTGDHTPFYTRPISHSDFIFPINSKDYKNATIVIIVDKRYSSVEIPIHFFSSSEMIHYNQKVEMIFGFILGMGLLFMLFHFLFFVYLNDFIYLWYGLFQLCLFLFIMVENGYLFQFLYPSKVQYNDFLRPLILLISTNPLFLFFNLVLDLPKNFPRLYKFNLKIVSFYALIMVTTSTHALTGSSQIQLFWLKVGSVLSPSLSLLLIIEAFYCFFKNIRFSGYLVSSILGNNILVIVFILTHNQLIPNNFFFSNAIYFAFLWELSIMTLVMVRRYSHFREQSEQLQIKMRQQQETVYKIIVDNQEKELQRVSSLLHDSVGANLGLLRLDIENMDLSEDGRGKVAAKIAVIGNDIRKLSHSLSPILLEDKGLAKSVEDWINQINNKSPLIIQYEWVGPAFPLGDKMEVIAFRIVQEMIQNVMKHAKATHAFLQIVVSDSFVSIYTEDNGIGISPEHLNKGVGIRNIEKMMEMLGGNCVIESAPGNGFNISVEFNYQFNENI